MYWQIFKMGMLWYARVWSGGLYTLYSAMKDNSVIDFDSENPYYYVDDYAVYSVTSFNDVHKAVIEIVVDSLDGEFVIKEGVDLNGIYYEIYHVSTGDGFYQNYRTKVFSNCENIVIDNNDYFSYYDGVLYLYNEYSQGIIELVVKEAHVEIKDGCKYTNGVFSYNKVIEEIVLPSSIENITTYDFIEAINLKRVYLTNSITNIYDYAFMDCESLSDIYYAGTMMEWKSIEFGYNWDLNTGNYVIHCSDGDIAKEDFIND